MASLLAPYITLVVPALLGTLAVVKVALDVSQRALDLYERVSRLRRRR